jgi:urea carboxylase-associated protein 2
LSGRKPKVHMDQFAESESESESETSTLEAARAHARSLAADAANQVISSVTVPTASVVDLPAGVRPADVRWDETIVAGGYAARLLSKGARLRIADAEGDANVHLLVFNAHNTAERLNVADTVKVQWQAYLGEGSLLLSDMGRALMTVVQDTSGRQDCLCGTTNHRSNDEAYGDGGASGTAPNGRDLLSLAGAKHGLSRVDIGPGINLFKSVVVADDGSLTLDGQPRPVCEVVLAADLDVLVLVANTPHPLDGRAEYTSSPVRLTAWQSPDPEASWRDGWSTPERERARVNTAEYLLEVGR